MNIEPRETCRVCRRTPLDAFLSLGNQPPANAFLNNAAESEESFPLGLSVCPGCQLMQVTHVVPAELLFRGYMYFSSVSRHMADHFAHLAHEVSDRFVTPQHLVVEIGSNDGILLQSLLNRPVRILGVDPAETCAAQARARGIPTVVDFFNARVARQIVDEHGAAAAVLGNNVMAHIDDLHETMRGLQILVAPQGVMVFEMPYVVDFFEKIEFDTIYHEHLSIFGLHAFSALLSQYGFEIFEARRTPVHGGSVRIFASRVGDRPVDRSVADLMEIEDALHLDEPASLKSFAEEVGRVRRELQDMVSSLIAEGRRVVGYTAPAKGNVLLNYCQLGPDKIQYLADATPIKQGRFSPGMHIPVVSPEHFREDAPDYAVLLAWNHREEVLEREKAWREAGGRFIIPLPHAHVI